MEQKIPWFHKIRFKYLVTIALLAVAVGLVLRSADTDSRRNKLVYCQSLDCVAATVNGKDLTLRDTAFYVAYEEAQVQEQALVYDPEDTSRYWNAHIDKVYIRTAARDAAIQMAVHDEIFYQMAMEEQLVLSEEEEASLLDAQADFWADLTDRSGQEGLGVSREEIDASLRRIAYAQKYQNIYAQLQGRAYEDYEFDKPRYKQFLGQQDYKIHADIWKRIRFGHITL